MKKIIELEIKSLTEEQKTELFIESVDWDGDTEFYHAKPRQIYWNENYKTFEQFAGVEYLKNMDEEELEETKKKYEEYIDEKTFEEYVGKEYLKTMNEEELEEVKKEYEEYIDEDENKQFFFRDWYPVDDPFVWGHNEIDDALIDYFGSYRDEFIKFQKDYENSLYNQAIKQNNFKDLNYEDVLKNLSKEQKDKIINDISNFVENYQSKDYIADYARKYDGTPYIEKISDEDRQIIEGFVEEYDKLDDDDEEAIEKFWEKYEDHIEQRGNNFFYKDSLPLNDAEEVENYKNNRYVLVTPNEYEYEDWTRLKFFKDQNETILFGLENKTIAPRLLEYNNETLNPNHQADQWVVKNHKLEEKQKEKLNEKQIDKLEEPKMKM